MSTHEIQTLFAQHELCMGGFSFRTFNYFVFIYGMIALTWLGFSGHFKEPVRIFCSFKVRIFCFLKGGTMPLTKN